MQVGIQTTQNVEINYEIASIGDRILAAMIDYLVIAGYVVSCIIFFASASVLLDDFPVTAIVIASLPIAFYDLLSEIFMEGQSLGKRQRQIKVVKLDGTQPDIGSYLLRWLLRLVEITFTSGTVAILVLLINRRGQRLGDMAAGTTVVKVRPRVTLEDTIFSLVEEGYVPVFPQAARLSEEDALIIREALNAEARENDGVAAAILSARAKQLFGIHDETPALPFLRTLLKDYNYYAGR
jgi:uncharacterized RDD family membrane protein YckC